MKGGEFTGWLDTDILGQTARQTPVTLKLKSETMPRSEAIRDPDEILPNLALYHIQL